MKQYYAASLIHHGVLGGGLIADEESLTYKTGKVTVDRKFRNLQMKYEDMASAQSRWVFIFPILTVFMKTGESYRFLVFAPGKIRKLLENHQITVR